MRAIWILLFGVTGVLAGPLLDDLTQSQQSELAAGKLVVNSEEIEGAPWPRLKVYAKVDAPVESVEEVFRDYKGAATYIPGLKSAEVLSQPHKNIYEVRYTSSLPLAGETRSTVRNTYTREGKALVVKWELIEADMAEESTGELRVEPNGKGSILRYTNFVRPKSSLAVVAKFAALGEVKKTVAALRSESERRANSEGS